MVHFFDRIIFLICINDKSDLTKASTKKGQNDAKNCIFENRFHRTTPSLKAYLQHSFQTIPQCLATLLAKETNPGISKLLSGKIKNQNNGRNKSDTHPFAWFGFPLATKQSEHYRKIVNCEQLIGQRDELKRGVTAQLTRNLNVKKQFGRKKPRAPDVRHGIWADGG